MTGVDMRSRDLCSRFQETACSPEALEAHREIPDESLVQRGIEGDKEALEILFARHARAAYRRAFQLLRNREDAEDAVQEGLLSAYRNLPQFQHRSQFSTWFTRIVINASLMQLRRRRQRAGTISLDEDQQEDSTTLATVVADPGRSPEQIYAGAESRSILENSIKDLPQFLRPALEFRYLVGLSCQETARALSLSEGSVKAYLHRGRLKLAHRMKESASHRHQDCLPTRQLPRA
jgi:RNA polymerase sigma-70 factor, ECF subfamily